MTLFSGRPKPGKSAEETLMEDMKTLVPQMTGVEYIPLHDLGRTSLSRFGHDRVFPNVMIEEDTPVSSSLLEAVRLARRARKDIAAIGQRIGFSASSCRMAAATRYWNALERLREPKRGRRVKLFPIGLKESGVLLVLCCIE